MMSKGKEKGEEISRSRFSLRRRTPSSRGKGLTYSDYAWTATIFYGRRLKTSSRGKRPSSEGETTTREKPGGGERDYILLWGSPPPRSQGGGGDGEGENPHTLTLGKEYGCAVLGRKKGGGSLNPLLKKDRMGQEGGVWTLYFAEEPTLGERRKKEGGHIMS